MRPDQAYCSPLCAHGVDPPSSEPLPASLHICTRLDEFRALVESCDVIVTLGDRFILLSFFGSNGEAVGFGYVYPFFCWKGYNERPNPTSSIKITSYQNNLETLKIQLRAGDFFMCADERQRDYLLGLLSGLGRINPYTYQDDHSLRRLIDVVPFGLRATPSRHTRPCIERRLQNDCD